MALKSEERAESVSRSNSGKIATIDALTGIRFIAALLVYLSHLPFTSSDLPKPVRSFMAAGYNGVTLFFVLSGFVICYNYYDKFQQNFWGGLRPFFVARFARIYPMYLFMFLFFFTSSNLSTQFKTQGMVVLQQLTLTQAWNPDVTVAFSYNAPSWSVGVEAFLYLMFPLLAYFILRYCRQVWQLVLLGGLAYGVALGLAAGFALTGHNLLLSSDPSHYWLYRIPMTRLGDFILGCVAARIYMLQANKVVGALAYKVGILALAVSVAMVVIIMAFLDQPFMVPFRYDAGYSLFFVVIIFCLARYRTWISQLLSTRLLVLLGEASYSFYLLHQMLIITYIGRLNTPGEAGSYLFGILLFLMITLLAMGTFTYLETPLRKLIRRLALPKPIS